MVLFSAYSLLRVSFLSRAEHKRYEAQKPVCGCDEATAAWVDAKFRLGKLSRNNTHSLKIK
ncbi:hypothetical protein HDV63DRAFT_371631 [Trichoderma sp. SZMC 28014]